MKFATSTRGPNQEGGSAEFTSILPLCASLFFTRLQVLRRVPSNMSL